MIKAAFLMVAIAMFRVFGAVGSIKVNLLPRSTRRRIGVTAAVARQRILALQAQGLPAMAGGSLSARTPTTYKTNYFIPVIYSKRIEKAVHNKLVAWPAINTSWETELKFGDTLNIGKTNTVTASEVVVGTAGTATNPFNTTGVQLTINQWYECPVDVDTMSKRQTQIDPESEAVRESAYAIQKQIDTSVCALFSALNASSVQGADGQTLVDDMLIDYKETLDERDVPDEERALIIDPSGLADMLKWDKLVSDMYVAKGAVNRGNIGEHPVYGCSVRVTNNLAAATTGNYAVMLHKRAIGGAAQIEKSWMDADSRTAKEKHQIRYHSEALWGVIEVQDQFAIPFYSRKA